MGIAIGFIVICVVLVGAAIGISCYKAGCSIKKSYEDFKDDEEKYKNKT